MLFRVFCRQGLIACCLNSIHKHYDDTKFRCEKGLRVSIFAARYLQQIFQYFEYLESIVFFVMRRENYI